MLTDVCCSCQITNFSTRWKRWNERELHQICTFRTDSLLIFIIRVWVSGSVDWIDMNHLLMWAVFLNAFFQFTEWKFMEMKIYHAAAVVVIAVNIPCDLVCISLGDWWCENQNFIGGTVDLQRYFVLSRNVYVAIKYAWCWRATLTIKFNRRYVVKVKI